MPLLRPLPPAWGNGIAGRYRYSAVEYWGSDAARLGAYLVDSARPYAGGRGDFADCDGKLSAAHTAQTGTALFFPRDSLLWEPTSTNYAHNFVKLMSQYFTLICAI